MRLVMRDSMIFYRSFYEAIKELPLETQGEIYNAIFTYGLDFEVTELSGVSKTIWTLIKPQIDANIKRFENGKKPKNKQTESKTEAKNNQDESKTETNNNNNVNDNVNVNDINNNIIESFDFDGLLVFINSTFGKNFKLINDKVKKKYKALIKQGYDKKQIIQAMVNAKENSYHKETGYQYCTPEFFSRTETIDKYSSTTTIQNNNNTYVPNLPLN